MQRQLIDPAIRGRDAVFGDLVPGVQNVERSQRAPSDDSQRADTFYAAFDAR